MLGSLILCMNSLLKSRNFNFLDKFKSGKRRASKKFAPDLGWLTSSSAATEVSHHQLEQVFKFIDTNGGGKISSLELSEVLLCLGHTKSLATKKLKA